MLIALQRLAVDQCARRDLTVEVPAEVATSNLQCKEPFKFAKGNRLNQKGSSFGAFFDSHGIHMLILQQQWHGSWLPRQAFGMAKWAALSTRLVHIWGLLHGISTGIQGQRVPL